MAARSWDPVTGVGPFGEAFDDVSTEANTPWMLADYAVSLTVQQNKLDSIKRIDGVAQIDLLLCKDPSCSIVADLKNILPVGTNNGTSVLAMGFSGIPLNEIGHGGGLQTAAGVSIGTIRNQERTPQLEDVPESWASQKLDDATIKQVQWRVNSASFIKVATCGRTQGLELLPIKDLVKRCVKNGTLQGLQVGHYRARKLLIGGLARSDGGECVTIVWPSHPWFIERGWNSSDKGCVEEYQAVLADPMRSLPRVYLFDSYVPQAHVLLNPRLAGALGPWQVVTVPYNESTGGSSYHKYNISFLTGSQADLAARLPDEAPPGFANVAGQLSMTLGNYHSGVWWPVTQEYDGCLRPCAKVSSSRWENNSAVAGLDCGMCDILVVGTAAIAVREARPVRQGNMNVTADYSAAIGKLRDYALFDLNDPEDLPWCIDWRKPSGANDSNLIFAYDSSVSGAHVVFFTNGSTNIQTTTQAAQEAYKGGILYNCSLLRSLRLGFVDHTWDKSGEIVPSCVGDVCVPGTTAFVESLLWMSLETRPEEDSITALNPMEGGVVFSDGIARGVQGVVQQAARVLQQHAAQELATTDATRSLPGALLDLSVTIVAIVAMASGLRDVHGWLYRWLSWAVGSWFRHQCMWVWVCKPLTAVIVLLGLFMAPVYILVSDKQSDFGNAHGKSSTVGWLAAKTDDDSRFMVVAAVAIRLVSVRDMHAYGLEIFNVILAGMASLGILLSLIFRLPFSPTDGAGSHQALPTSDRDDGAPAVPTSGVQMVPLGPSQGIAPAAPSPGSNGPPTPSPGAPSGDMAANKPPTPDLQA